MKKAQYFANRSFIAMQVGDMRDVGAAVGYDFRQSGCNAVDVMALYRQPPELREKYPGKVAE